MDRSDDAQSEYRQQGRPVVGRSGELDRIAAILFDDATLPEKIVLAGEAGIDTPTSGRVDTIVTVTSTGLTGTTAVRFGSGLCPR